MFKRKDNTFHYQSVPTKFAMLERPEISHRRGRTVNNLDIIGSQNYKKSMT